MNKNISTEFVADDLVVTIDYKLTVDGEIVDASEEGDPLVYLHGHENIIPGLEKELKGLKVGDSRKVSVQPTDGYGEIDAEAVVEVRKDEIPTEIPMEVGVELQVTNEDDEILSATITQINKDTVTLDFNHPLAGKVLNFEISVLEIREATEEELEHGHVHGEDFDFDDEEFYFEEEDEEEEEE